MDTKVISDFIAACKKLHIACNKLKGVHVDNQHRKITGYRELSQQEINAMNRVKELGVQLGEVIEDFSVMDDIDIDKRWLEIGRADLQKGLMAVVRSITKPTTF